MEILRNGLFVVLALAMLASLVIAVIVPFRPFVRIGGWKPSRLKAMYLFGVVVPFLLVSAGYFLFSFVLPPAQTAPATGTAASTKATYPLTTPQVVDFFAAQGLTLKSDDPQASYWSGAADGAVADLRAQNGVVLQSRFIVRHEGGSGFAAPTVEVVSHYVDWLVPQGSSLTLAAVTEWVKRCGASPVAPLDLPQQEGANPAIYCLHKDGSWAVAIVYRADKPEETPPPAPVSEEQAPATPQEAPPAPIGQTPDAPVAE